MAANMDDRVVSMEFDNKNFEKNVKTSIKTIDDLKESLDFDDSTESLDQLDKKFKEFGKNDKLLNGLDGTMDKLRMGMMRAGDATMGMIQQFAEITKITAMIQMAERAIQSLERTIKQFTVAPVKEGFEKYTTKIGAIKTISNATKLGAEQVNEELERLNWFTDETSASFGNMVENIGKFTSVGRGLDESITAMQGIATWGYQSGAGVQEINRAMYNLSQALGTGSVKLMDWKSIENAGMATEEFKNQAIAAAEAAGKLRREGDKLFTTGEGTAEEVTAANFNSTLAKGWFSSDVLMSVLEQYGGFATELRKYMEENPEFEQAKDAMEQMDKERLNTRAEVIKKNYDILGKKTGKTIEQIEQEISEIADEDKLKEKEKAVEKFAKSFGIEMAEVRRISGLTNTAEREKEIDKWAKQLGISAADATRILQELADTEESLGEKAFKSSQQSKSLEDAINATKDAVSTGWMNTFQTIFGGLDESIELWSDVTDILWDLFAAGADSRNNAFLHWADEFAGRDDLWGEEGIMHSIMDTIIDLKNILGSSFKNVFFKDLEKALNMTPEADDQMQIMNGGLTVEQIRYRREGNYFGKQIKNITQGMKNFGLTVRDFAVRNMEKFGQIFESVATVAKFFGSIVGGVFRTIGNFIKDSGIFQDILNIATEVANKIRNVVERIQSSGFVTKVLTNIGNTLKWFYETIKKWISQISAFLEETGIGQAIRNFFKRIEEFFLGGESDIDENGKRTESGFFRAFAWLGTVKEWIDSINLKDILYTIKGFVENFGTLWNAFTTGLSGEKVDTSKMVDNGLPETLKGVADAFGTVGNKLSGVVNFFKSIWEKFTGWLESSGILPTLRGWWNGIAEFFGNIGLIWEAFTKGKVADPKKLNKKQQALVSGVIGFAKKLQGAFEKVKNWFASAWEWIKGIWGNITGWLETSGILPKIREIWQGVKDVFGNIGLLWNTFVLGQKVDPSQLTATQNNLITTVQGFFENVRSAWDGAVGWLESSGILPTLRSWWEGITSFFEEVAKSIGEGSIFQKVGDFFADLWGKITGLFGGGGQEEAIQAVTDATSNAGQAKPGNKKSIIQPLLDLFKNDGTGGGFDFLKLLSRGINGLFKTIGEFDWTSLSTNVFGVMVQVINGLDTALGQLKIDNIIKFINQVVSAITWGLAIKTVDDIALLVRSIVKKGKETSAFEEFANVLSSFATAILNAGIAFLLISAALWIISQIDENGMKKVTPILIGIGIFFAAVLAYAAIFRNSKNLATILSSLAQSFLYIGISMALLSVSLLILTLLFDKANPKALESALWTMGVMIVAMAAILVIMSKLLGNDTVRVSAGIAFFAGMAILVAVMTVCIILLQGVDFLNAISKMGILALFIVIMGVTIKMIDKVKIDGKTIGILIMISVMIGVLTAAFLLLKDMDPVKMLEIAGIFALVIGVAIVAVHALKNINPVQSLQAALALGAILTAIFAALAIGGLIISGTAMTMIDTLTNIMSSLGAAGISAETINKDAIMDAIGLLDDIVAAFAKTTSADTTIALKVADDTWVFLNRLKLASISAEKISVEQFKKIFGEDGTSGILPAITTGLSNVTETGDNALKLAANLQEFGTKLESFGLNAAKFSDGHESKYGAGIKALFGTDGKSGLFPAIKEGISGITDTGWNARVLLWNLADMGNHIELLAQSGSKLGEESGAAKNIENVKNRMNDLNAIVTLAASLNKAASEGGAEVDLTDISVGIANIGAALQLYNKAIEAYKEEVKTNQGVDLDAGETVQPISADNIKTALDQIVTSLPDISYNSDAVQKIESWATMNKSEDGKTTLFALGLVSMANAISEFSNQAKDFDSVNSQLAIMALAQLAGIYNSVGGNPGQYDGTISGIAGWNDKIGGTADNNAFSAAIISMGNALANFSTSAENFNYIKGMRAIGALRMLANIYEISGMKNPENYNSMINGVQQWDLGEKTGGTGYAFTEAIISMGNAMKSFGDSVKGINPDSVTNATTALETLAALYQELKPGKNDEMIKYFATMKNTDMAKWLAELQNKSVTEVFKDFGEGIGLLSDGLAALGLAVSGDKEAGAKPYDSEKVNAAVQVLKDLGDLDIALRSSKNIINELPTLLKPFSKEENISTLGTNLSGLGAKMTQFSKELNGTEEGKGFNLDTTQQMWTNFKEVLTFLSGIAIDIGRASLGQTFQYNLTMLADDALYFATQLRDFDIKMTTQFDNGDGSGKHYMGDWAQDRWENVKAYMTLLKDISIEMATAGLKEHQFYDLNDFGYDLERFAAQLSGDSMSKFISKFATPANFDSATVNFVEFTRCLRSIANATVYLAQNNVKTEDINSLGSLVNALTQIDTTGIDESNFYYNGLQLASQFVDGFLGKILGTENGVDGTNAAKTALDGLIASIESYIKNQAFFDEGRTAGNQFASGFNQGMKDIALGNVTPVRSMSTASGGAKGETQNALGVLAYNMTQTATSADITKLSERVGEIKAKFDNPIKVQDDHINLNGIGSNVGVIADKIVILEGAVDDISTKLDTLRVYIDSQRLVGAIAPDMDRALGKLVNVS